MATADENASQDDRRYMAQALALARRGWGLTAPNPSVGAVIVQGAGATAEIVGRGWTQSGGRPHAETEALARAGERARGATLYVTLEPCSHHGKTPPCADAVVKAGISRVVVGIGDPDARVAGQGMERLRQAGIEVVEAVLGEEAQWVTAGHIRRVYSARPFVQMKLAVSANDIIPHGDGGPIWVTATPARGRVHLMRAQADAILTGIGTVMADDPELTCRLPGLFHRSPARVVLDPKLRLPLQSKLVQTARSVPVLVICARRPDAKKAAKLEAAGLELIPVGPGRSGQDGLLDWDGILRKLANRDVTRLMVEAGPTIARDLDCQIGTVDEYVLFRGTKSLSDEQGTPLYKVWSLDHLKRMQVMPVAHIGSDTVQSFRSKWVRRRNGVVQRGD